MAVITVLTTTVPLEGQAPSNGTSFTLRVFTTQNWTTYEGVTMTQGNGTNVWYADYVCTVSANVITVPALTLYSTTDRLQRWLQPAWTAFWMDGGQVVGVYFQGYIVGPLTPTTKAALDAYQPSQNNNQRWNEAAYNTTQSDALFPKLTGLTPNYCPKVVTDQPARLADSLFNDNGTDAQIDVDSGSLVLGTVNPAYLYRTGGFFPGYGPQVGIRDGNGDESYFISGGVLQNFGRLGTATIPVNATGTQTLFSPSYDALITMVIARNPTGDFTAWPGQAEIGTNGGDEFGTYDFSDMALDASVHSYAVLQNFVGALGNIFRGSVCQGSIGDDFTMSPSNTLSSGSVTWDVYGIYLF